MSSQIFNDASKADVQRATRNLNVMNERLVHLRELRKTMPNVEYERRWINAHKRRNHALSILMAVCERTHD